MPHRAVTHGKRTQNVGNRTYVCYWHYVQHNAGHQTCSQTVANLSSCSGRIFLNMDCKCITLAAYICCINGTPSKMLGVLLWNIEYMHYILCHFASGLQFNKSVLLCLQFIRVDSQLTWVIPTKSESRQCIHFVLKLISTISKVRDPVLDNYTAARGIKYIFLVNLPSLLE